MIPLLSLLCGVPSFPCSPRFAAFLAFRPRIRAWISVAERASSPACSGSAPCSTAYSVAHISAAKPATCTSQSKRRGVVEASCHAKNAAMAKATPAFKKRSVAAKLIPGSGWGWGWGYNLGLGLGLGLG